MKNLKFKSYSDVNTYSVLIFVEKGFELHIDKNFQKILGFDYSILKNVMQRCYAKREEK